MNEPLADTPPKTSAPPPVAAVVSLVLALITIPVGCGSDTGSPDDGSWDLILVGGTVYDGSGAPAYEADVAIAGDTVAAVGDLEGGRADTVIDVTGLAVAPGFVNAHSWATGSLLIDGRSMSDLKQGVTTVVFGEGITMGPINERLRELYGNERDRDYPPPGYDITWSTLRGYLQHLEERGVTPNVTSFVGATTLRQYEVGNEDRPPTAGELRRMTGLVAQEMQAGALGLGSRLAYAPASYAETPELVTLARASARYGGRYISHIRSEGGDLLPALDEFLEIVRTAPAPGTVYHLKAAGRANWPKMDTVIRRIRSARGDGHDVTATVYPYRAGSTGLDACLPPWAHEGGPDSLRARLQDPEARERMAADMQQVPPPWENYCKLSGSPENVLLLEFARDSLAYLQGRTLAAVAEEWDVSPETATMDLVLRDRSLVQTAYFLMSEANLRRKIRQPWVFFGSDAPSVAADSAFTASMVHPRAYGTFAKVLSDYVREEDLIPLTEAVRRMTSLPASQFGLAGRGLLAPGAYADVVVFDPDEVEDRATYEAPHRYAEGIRHVLVNGRLVLRDGEHTGDHPGRALTRDGR